MALIYKILKQSEWSAAVAKGVFEGSGIDLQDGYIHFSTADQMRQTAALYFAGQADLVLVEIDDQAFSERLVYEASRGGALFPHLYGTLATRLVNAAYTLTVRPDGLHVFPGDAL